MSTVRMLTVSVVHFWELKADNKFGSVQVFSNTLVSHSVRSARLTLLKPLNCILGRQSLHTSAGSGGLDQFNESFVLFLSVFQRRSQTATTTAVYPGSKSPKTLYECLRSNNFIIMFSRWICRETLMNLYYLLPCRISYDPTRYPKYIPEAYCLCKGCLMGIFGEENFHFRSTPVYMPTVILRRTSSCAGGRYVYTEDYVTIPVGCTCVPEPEKEAESVNSSIDKQEMKLLVNQNKPSSEWRI